jgi:hypothetical protein
MYWLILLGEILFLKCLYLITNSHGNFSMFGFMPFRQKGMKNEPGEAELKNSQ